MGTFLFLDELNDSEGERCWRGGEMYKYPLALNSHLSRGSAAAQVRQCRSPGAHCCTRQDSNDKSKVLAVLAK